MDQLCGVKFIYPFKYELFKVLKIVGQNDYQIVIDRGEGLDYPVHHIIEVNIAVESCTDRAFKDKVVRKGKIRTEIIYCDRDWRVRSQFSRAHFTAAVPIPGLRPETELEIEDHNPCKEVKYRLLDNKTIGLTAVISGELLVSRWVEERLQVCTTNINYFSQVSPRVSYRCF